MKRKLPLAITAALTLPALAAVLPFTEAFESGLGEFTVEDTNNDEVTFQRRYARFGGYNNSDAYIRYEASSEKKNDADDWLFTPALELKKGFVYELSYQYKTPGYQKTNRIEWKAGKTASSESMTVDIAEVKEYGYISSWTKETVKITVPEDGEWYIGLHLISMAEQGDVYLDQFEISEGINEMTPMAPEVSEPVFSIVDEDLQTSFEIEIPSTTVGGNPIEESEVEIFVAKDEDSDFGSVKGAPGTTVPFVDTEASSSSTTYTFHTMINGLESEKVEKIANPRFGTPKAVENFTVSQEGNEFTLSWDAVTEAVNASDLFNPAQVKYLVKCNGETVADNTSELTATYTCPMPEDGQEPVSFTILAIASGRQSGVVTSDSYMVGDPYTGEFKESFAGRAFSNKTWVIENNKGWSISTGSSFSPSVNPHDSDGGCLEFALNGTAKIWSPVLNLSTLQNPKVKFYAYLYPSSYYETTIQPGFMVNGEEIVVGEPISLKSGTEGWTEFIIDVPAEAQENNCQLMFTGTGTYAYSGKFYIDNISIVSYLDHNLAVEVSSPVKSLEIGQEVTFPITIENKGANAENDYTLTLFADGEKVAEAQGPEVEPMGNASAELSFKALPKYAGQEIEFTIALTLDGDGDEEDNEAELSIPVNGNDLERVQSVNATLATDASKVTLEWTAPEVSTEPTYAEVTESFEDWEAGSMEAQNGWIFIDADDAAQNGINNVNFNEKFAAMVAENFTAAYSWNPSLECPDGTKALAITDLVYSYNTDSDNWIISPEVKGGTEVTFYAMTFTTSDPELFSVYYSEGGTEVSDFIELEEYVLAPKYNSSAINEWGEISIDLPAKARRFAIRVSGSHKSPILFDAFTFTATSSPAVHTGFNVYRDHELLAAYPAETLSHVDNEPVLGNEHVYHVTALYDKGESHYSEPMNVKVELETGIGEIEVSAEDAEFFTLQGLRIERPAAGEIVIVRKGDKTFKAVVR